MYLGFRSNVPPWPNQKSSRKGLEGSLLISAKIETMWLLQGGFQYLKYSIFFHRSSLFHRWGLKVESWAFWTIRTCLNPYHIDQILENQFFSKTAHPKIYPQPRISCMDLMEACCTGICLAHSLWEFCSWGRRCLLWVWITWILTIQTCSHSLQINHMYVCIYIRILESKRIRKCQKLDVIFLPYKHLLS